MGFPKTIYLCYKTLQNTEKYVNNWKKLNPEYTVKIFDNEMCYKFLLEEYSDVYANIFNYMQHGPIKADFWRICILYKYGGVYSDIDNQPLKPISSFLEPDVDFVTCSSYWDEMKFNFNPNFIISNKGNVILKNCIDWYVKNYKKKISYSYWYYSIMNVFTQTLQLDNYKDWELLKKLEGERKGHPDGVYLLGDIKVQIIQECEGVNHYDAHNIYKNVRIFNNRYPEWDSNTHTFK